MCKMEQSPIEKWIETNRGSDKFDEALRTLVSYACAEWFRRSTGMLLQPGEALSRILLSGAFDGSLGAWLEKPDQFCREIADFCEKIRFCPLPDSLKDGVSHLLDLRGVKCPSNAARSRLVMAGFPYDTELEIWLDEGSPIENVPGALVADGHKVVFREKKADYWVIKVVRPSNKE